MGTPKFSDIDKEKNVRNINSDNTYINTSRFRVYKNYVLRYYPPHLFDHIEFKSSSRYVVKNKQNTFLNKNKLEEFLLDYIESEY